MTIQTARGRGRIRAPTCAHSPVSLGSGLPSAGRTGQNTQRPQMTSRAGSRVMSTMRVTPTPMAETGPRPLVEFMAAASRHSIPRITVLPLARMAGPARWTASVMASCRSSCSRSSSR